MKDDPPLGWILVHSKQRFFGDDDTPMDELNNRARLRADFNCVFEQGL